MVQRTEVNRTGSSHEGSHSPAGELKQQIKGRGGGEGHGCERGEDGESQGGIFPS